MSHKFVRLFALLVLISTLLWDLGPSGGARASDDAIDDKYVPGQLVMKLRSPRLLAAVARKHSLSKISQFGRLPVYRMKINNGANPLTVIAALEQDFARVVYATPIYLETTPEADRQYSWSKGSSATGYVQQWAPGKVRLARAHQVTKSDVKTMIAVVDTGIDLTHPRFAGRLASVQHPFINSKAATVRVTGFDFVGRTDADPSEIGIYGADPAYGHGTHVSGIATLAAPGAKILPVRALDRNGVTNLWMLREAIEWVVNPDRNLRTDDGADVINLSLSTSRRLDLLEDLIEDITCSGQDNYHDDDDGDGIEDNEDSDDDGDGQDDGNPGKTRRGSNSASGPGVAGKAGSCPVGYAGGKGVVVVAAAGNEGNTVPQYPAAMAVPGLVSVGASTSLDTIAIFSSRGSWVNVAAPGQGITSTVPGGGYGIWSGTSMASPFVAGEAALIRTQYPALKAVEIAQRLRATGKFIQNNVVQYRIDAAYAVGVPR